MTITINDTGISEKRRRVLATEGFASDNNIIIIKTIDPTFFDPNGT